jgi:hypothetical protein
MMPIVKAVNRIGRMCKFSIERPRKTTLVLFGASKE